MPIIGKINSVPYENRIENMEVGGEGYLHISEIMITKAAVFLDITSPVIPADDMNIRASLADYIPIKRIGLGLSEDDFVIDFTNSDEADLIIESHGVYLDLIEDSESYIIFFLFEIGKNGGKDINQNFNKKIELLRSKLKLAVEKEDYAAAIVLRDKIDLLTRKKK